VTAARHGTLHEIVDGVHAWVQPDGTWFVNNAGAVTGEDGTLVIDTCATEARTRRFLAAVAAATGEARVRWAVNTHPHGDHTHGNSLLPEDAVLISHEGTRHGIRADPVIDGCPPVFAPVPDWGAVSRRVPSVTLRGELTVWTGERRVDLRHPGYPAHSRSDVVAWLPEERVLFTGDLLFHGLTPLVFSGSLDGARQALEWIAGFQADHVVPGHGPLLTAATLPAVLAAHERYYGLVAACAREGRRAGLTPLAAARNADLGEFTHWPDSERIVANIHRAYADASGAHLDPLEALADAVTWLGRLLPTSA
jgi:cyclase